MRGPNSKILDIWKINRICIFHPILMQFCSFQLVAQRDSCSMSTDFHYLVWFSEISSLEWGPTKAEFQNLGGKIAYLESICNTWNSKTRQWLWPITVSNTLLCLVIYRVKQNTASTLAFNIHVNIQLSLFDILCSCYASPCIFFEFIDFM